MTRHTVKSVTARFSQYFDSFRVWRNTEVAATRLNNARIGWFCLRAKEGEYRLACTAQTLTEIAEFLVAVLCERRIEEAMVLERSLYCELPTNRDIIEADFDYVPEEVFPLLPEGYSIVAAPEICTTRLMSYRHHYLMFEGRVVDGGYDMSMCESNMRAGYWLSAWESYPDRFRCDLLTPVITEQPETCYHAEHLGLGFCYSYEADGTVTVYCPDTTAQNWPSLDMAEQAIREGWHNVGQYCPVDVLESPVDELGYTEVLLSPVIEGGYPWVINPLDQLLSVSEGNARLVQMGYDPNEFYIGCDERVYTYEGVCVGHISEFYAAPSYLTEDEYHSHQHEMMF